MKILSQKNWKPKPGTDIRAAVLATLTGPKRMFKRDPKKTGWWITNSPSIVEVKVSL